MIWIQAKCLKITKDLQNSTELEEILIALQCQLRGEHGQRKRHKLPPKCARIRHQIHRHQMYLSCVANRQITRQDLEILKFVVLRLCWLKENNHYYKDIIIDNEILQSLPVDGSIDDRFQNTRIVAEDLDHDEDDDMITRRFFLRFIAKMSPSKTPLTVCKKKIILCSGHR